MEPSPHPGPTANTKPPPNASPADQVRKSIVLAPLPVDAAKPRWILRHYGRPDMHFVQARAARLLVNAAETFPAMLAAIDAAADRVDLETYTLRDDSTGQAFQQALIRAASRGVRVRLLYDWIGSFALSRGFVSQLVEAGVAVAAYHPLLVRRPFWALNRRDHRKILVVDDAAAFTGGINLGDEFNSISDGGQGWRDTHVCLEGPEVARAMAALFEYAWGRATPYDAMRTRRTQIQHVIRRRWATLLHRKKRPESASEADEGVPVSLVGNEVWRHRRRIHLAHLKAIGSARRYVMIENAYFIPSKPVRRALIKAAQRGLFVGVVVTTHSDVPITAYAARWLYDELLAGGVRLFEWPDSMMHAKTAVVDDTWSIIGSYNFDHRSLFHQLECVAVIADAGFAVGVREQVLADIARCREVSLEVHRRRPWRQKVLEFVAFLLRHWL